MHSNCTLTTCMYKTHILSDCMVESAVSHVSIELAHGLRELDALRRVVDVLEILALHLLVYGQVEWPESLASISALHLDTDVTVTTGTHTVQNRAQESISVIEKKCIVLKSISMEGDTFNMTLAAKVF